MKDQANDNNLYSNGETHIVIDNERIDATDNDDQSTIDVVKSANEDMKSVTEQSLNGNIDSFPRNLEFNSGNQRHLSTGEKSVESHMTRSTNEKREWIE